MQVSYYLLQDNKLEKLTSMTYSETSKQMSHCIGEWIAFKNNKDGLSWFEVIKAITIMKDFLEERYILKYLGRDFENADLIDMLNEENQSEQKRKKI